jgi:hypothetical protein
LHQLVGGASKPKRMMVEKSQEALRISNSKASHVRENVRLQFMDAQRILAQGGQTLLSSCISRVLTRRKQE